MRRATFSLALLLLVVACSASESVGPPTTTATAPATTAAPATTTAVTTTAAPRPPGPTAAELCGLVTSSAEPAAVASDSLTEISGIAVSRQHEGLLWAHNDSGSRARLFLVDGATGADLGAWPLDGASAFDWEDMAIGTGPDGTHLYAADFGDNFRFRRDIRIYRALEPTDVSTPMPLPADEFIFIYPDGATDAESLFIDPANGDFIILSKSWDDGPTVIYRGAAGTETDTPTELERIGEVDLTGFNPLATAADITVDARVIGLRTLDEVLLWDRPAGVDIGTAMSVAPCVAPSIPEPQGEALAFLPDGSGYVTISEGANPTIHRFTIARLAG